MKKKATIIIPAYNPNTVLIELIENLKEYGYQDIVVIDDGSKKKDIFNMLDVTVLRNKKNLGKGETLRKGFAYCINQDKEKIITVDADGQHLVEDIDKVYDELNNYPNSLILGSRVYENGMTPFKNKIGNKIIDFLVNRRKKTNLKDTQTGLRGFSTKYLNQFIKIEGQYYEYELNMILYCLDNYIGIREVPIRRVYINKNKESNFKLVLDSIRIIKSIWD